MSDQNQSPEFQRRLAAQIKVHHEVEEYSVDHVDLPIKHVYKVAFRRVIAFVIDSILLTVAGIGIVLIAGERLAPVGFRGYWIGIAIELLYFGYFDSKLGCGRSIGKRLMGIEVRRLDGLPLDLSSALVRYLPFAIFGALGFVLTELNPFSISFIATVVLAWMSASSIIVVALFHPQRRGMQDLISGSIVVHAGVEFETKPAELKTPLVVLAIASAVIISGMLSLRWYALKMPYVNGIAHAMDSLSKLSDLSCPYVYHSPVIDERLPASRMLLVFAKVRDYSRFSDQQRLKALADGIQLALKSSSSIPSGISDVEIFLKGGYSIGLWGVEKSARFSMSAAGSSPPSIQYKIMPGKSQMPKAKAPAPKK